MSFVKIHIHSVWSTKNRLPLLATKEIRSTVWQHILVAAREKGIMIDFISGYAEHCHCLISLRSDQSVQKVIQLIKGESSFWINKHKLTKQKFEWQEGYFAASVSESMVATVRAYIKNQEAHHARRTFQDEYKDFIKKYKFEI